MISGSKARQHNPGLPGAAVQPEPEHVSQQTPLLAVAFQTTPRQTNTVAPPLPTRDVAMLYVER